MSLKQTLPWSFTVNFPKLPFRYLDNDTLFCKFWDQEGKCSKHCRQDVRHHCRTHSKRSQRDDVKCRKKADERFKSFADTFKRKSEEMKRNIKQLIKDYVSAWSSPLVFTTLEYVNSTMTCKNKLKIGREADVRCSCDFSFGLQCCLFTVWKLPWLISTFRFVNIKLFYFKKNLKVI